MPEYCGNVKCLKVALYKCGRCQTEHYCGKQCQVASFSTHRTQCFALPPLHEIEVKPADVDSPINCNGADDSDDSRFDKNSTRFTPICAEKVDQKTQDIDEKAKVKSALKQELSKPVPVKVPFDAGKRSEAPNSYIIPTKTIPTPIKKFVVEELKPKKNEVSTVGPSSVRRMAQGIPTLKLPTPEPIRTFLKDMNVRPLPTGKFRARLLLGAFETKLFAVYEHSEHAENYLSKIEQSIAEFVAKDDRKSYTPEKDEVLLAKYEGVFYRAFCTDRDSDGYSVFFIDYGNSSSVSEAELKPLDKSLMFDIIVHPCYFENLPDDLTQEVAELLSVENVLLDEAKLEPGKSIYNVKLCGV